VFGNKGSSGIIQKCKFSLNHERIIRILPLRKGGPKDIACDDRVHGVRRTIAGRGRGVACAWPLAVAW
jgi:hypothetical protein